MIWSWSSEELQGVPGPTPGGLVDAALAASCLFPGRYRATLFNVDQLHRTKAPVYIVLEPLGLWRFIPGVLRRTHRLRQAVVAAIRAQIPGALVHCTIR